MSFAEYNTDTPPLPQADQAGEQTTMDKASETFSEMAERSKAQMDANLQDLQRMTDDLGAEVSRAVTTAAEEGTRFVREHPGAALAGAVGLGVLVGLALRPRS